MIFCPLVDLKLQWHMKWKSCQLANLSVADQFFLSNHIMVQDCIQFRMLSHMRFMSFISISVGLISRCRMYVQQFNISVSSCLGAESAVPHLKP